MEARAEITGVSQIPKTRKIVETCGTLKTTDTP
jgi:hypothetical protein